MKPERWQKVREVFDAVCEAEDAEERIALVHELCGDDKELQQEVASLLEAADSKGSGLDTPGAGLLGGLLTQALAPAEQHIGPYRLVHLIATGGMGSVYLGERADEQFRMTVAIKLVRYGLADDEGLRRFRHERQTLATLNHPYIARLLDGGVTEGGVPYLVMEYIEGKAIDAFCDENQLSIPDRLTLFLKVCMAVEHAHHNLIIHRDLKPGNIFVTPDGEPKLLDFGIAKALELENTETAAHPLTKQRIMTPHYASPEQIRGEPMTTASDVYSLGVVLYELLTGRRPHVVPRGALHEIERAICEDEPARPSTAVFRTHSVAVEDGARPPASSAGQIGHNRALEPARLRRRLRGDLDAIVLMSLHKQPQERYASVEQFANDIRSHLEGSAILARRISTLNRWWKQVRQHRVALAAVLLVFISLLGGLIGIARARAREMAAAAQARAEAENARVEVDKSREVVHFLKNVLTAGTPADLGPDVTIRSVLDRSSRHVVEEFGDDPEVETAVRTAIAETYIGLGEYDEAEPHLRTALALQQDIHRGDHPDVARSMRNLGHLLYEMRRFEEAERVCREALNMARKLDTAPHEDLATDLNNLGAVLRARGQLDEAEQHLREALRLRRALPGQHGLEIAETLTNIGNLHRVRANLPQAESCARQALALRRAQLQPEDPLVTQALYNLSVVLGAQQRYDEAAETLKELVELTRRRLGPDHPHLANFLNALGGIHFLQEDYAAAEPLLRDCVRIRELRFGPQDHSTIYSQTVWVRCLARLSEFEDAERVLLTAVDSARKAADAALLSRAAAAAKVLYTLWEKPQKAAEYEHMIQDPGPAGSP
jgi:serine/threonine-protein kinase